MAIRIAAFTKNGVNPNYQAFLLGAERAALAAGAVLTRHFPARPDDAAEQAALLAAVATEAPAAILFAPADDVALRGPVAAVAAAGIPMVGFVNRMPGPFVSFIGADDTAMGRRIAEVMIAALGGEGGVVLIEGPESAPTSRDRGRGFRAAIAAAPGIRLLGSAPGRYLREPGAAAMAGLLAAHPRVDGAICGNDLMALGALDALAAAGRRALVVGNNGTEEALRAIGAGRLLASMGFDGFRMGALAAMAALRHLAGAAVPAEILLPAPVIDAANWRDFLTPPAARPLPDWPAG